MLNRQDAKDAKEGRRERRDSAEACSRWVRGLCDEIFCRVRPALLSTTSLSAPFIVFLGALGVLAVQTPVIADTWISKEVHLEWQDRWFDAVAENRYEEALGLMKSFIDFNVGTRQRTTELTALHFAAGGGAGEVAVMLLHRGAEVDARDTVQMTPLHHACELGQAKIAEVLLAHGADVNAVGGVHGYTPLHLAVQNDHADLAGALLDGGADLNAREGHGATPLHFAVLHGRAAAAERLIDRGADVADVTTDDGYTPLHLAALRGHVDCARLLVERGAPIGAEDGEGMTPLQRATANDAARVIEVLRNPVVAE